MEYGLFENLPHDEYRKIKALANSSALLFANNPSDFIWASKAPVDFAKVMTKDVGTALHAALLEPEKFDDLVYVSSVKGRQTKTFEQEVIDNPDHIVLTDEEAEKVRIMVGSVMAHPAANHYLSVAGGLSECSIVTHDHEFNIDLKCRPDRLIADYDICVDVKTTGDISKWRSDKEWINPMFEFNYGHNAAFYLHTLSLHYGREFNKYVFVVVSTTVQLGRYPVAVFEVTKDQLIEWGFWAQMLANLERYSLCKHNGFKVQAETFNFAVRDEYSDDVEVTFEGVEQ